MFYSMSCWTLGIHKLGARSGLEGEPPAPGTLRMPMATYQQTRASDSLPLDFSDAFPVDICDLDSVGP